MKRRNALALLGALPFASTSRAAQDNWPPNPCASSCRSGPAARATSSRASSAHELEKLAGQPFIVDNKPGATAMVGTAIVKNAPADGYTLLHGSTSSLAPIPASTSR